MWGGERVRLRSMIESEKGGRWRIRETGDEGGG